MGVLNESTIMGASGVSDPYTIDYSCRFNDGDSPYLSRTPSGAGDSTEFTISIWYKIASAGSSVTRRTLFSAGTSIHNEFVIGQGYSGAGDQINIQGYISGSGNFEMATNRLHRDPSGWYHIVVAVDTSESASADKCKLYINGNLETSFATDQRSSMGSSQIVNSAVSHRIGQFARVGGHYMDGYISEFHLIDGTALTASSFGETGDYGEWKPIEYTGSHGTNGFYLPFPNKATKHAITANGDAQHSTTQNKIGATAIKFDGTGDYLAVANSSDWAFSGDFTAETWFYNEVSTSNDALFGPVNHGAGGGWGVYFNGSGVIKYNDYSNGFNSGDVSTGWSVNTWHHLAITRSSGTVKMWLDGVEKYSGSNSSTLVNNGNFSIGSDNGITSSMYYTGYVDEFRLSNVARYTSGFSGSLPTSAFTEDASTVLLIHSDTTNSSTTFTDSSGVTGGLGNDASANSNHFTPNNITSSDQVTDSPTNNFATWNPLTKGSYVTFSEGNLRTDGNATDSGNVRSTFHMTTGKWYMEVLCQDASASYFYPWIGCIGDEAQIGIPSNGGSGQIGQVTTNSCAYLNNGTMYLNGSANSSWGSSFTDGDIIGMALDADNGALYFAKNNTWQNSGNPASGASKTGAAFTWTGGSITLAFALSDYDATTISNFGQDGTFAGNKTAQGNSDGNGYGNFYYAPPSSHLALCSQNLEECAVIPSEHFDTVIYTGDGGSDRTISTELSAVDFVWLKKRSGADDHRLANTVTGGNKHLKSNVTDVESTGTTIIKSFSGSTFNVGSDGAVNANSATYVAFNWKTGTTTSGTTSGVGTGKAYSASYNASAGFSIVSYLGNGSVGHTIPHHLGVAPELMIMTGRAGTDGWYVYSSPMGNTKGMQLNEQNAPNTTSAYWNNTSPTSSVWTVSNNSGNNTNDATYIAYCFSSIEGYSKIGTYQGNGNVDGSFVYTNFKPAFVICKKIDATGGWIMHDNARNPSNLAKYGLLANTSAAETSADNMIDLLSNGFKRRAIDAHGNATNSYMYYAIAEQPFKHSNAK